MQKHTLSTKEAQQAAAFEAKYAAMAQAINAQRNLMRTDKEDLSVFNADLGSRFYYWQVVMGHCAKIVKKLGAEGQDTTHWRAAMADARRRQENDVPASPDDFWFFMLDDGVSENVID